MRLTWKCLLCVVIGGCQAEVMQDEVAPAIEAIDMEPSFSRGDGNGDGSIDLTDAIFVLNHLFLGAAGPGCEDAADANDDGNLDLTDAIYLLNFLFVGGPPPPGAGTCAPDPTPDSLGCETSACGGGGAFTYTDEAIVQVREHGAVSMFLAGDASGDGLLDLDDLDPTGSCPAALDLDHDRSVGDGELSEVERLVMAAGLTPQVEGVFNLTQSWGDCTRVGLGIASRNFAVPGEEIPLLLLDGRISFDDGTTVRVASGPSTVRVESADRATIQIAASAETFDQTVVLIETPARTFTLTVTVLPPGEELEVELPAAGGGAAALPGEHHDGETECPQRGRGCCALFINLQTDVQPYPARSVQEHMVDLCGGARVSAWDAHTEMVPLRAPRRDELVPGPGGRRPFEDVFDRWRETFGGAPDRLRAEIDRYRECLLGGADTALEYVQAHGSPPEADHPCGEWSGGARTRTFSPPIPYQPIALDRARLWETNYMAAFQNVCTRAVLDASCFSGHTPVCNAHLNNSAIASGALAFGHDDGWHAGFRSNIALGSTTVGSVSYHATQCEPSTRRFVDAVCDAIAGGSPFESNVNPAAFDSYYYDSGYGSGRCLNGQGTRSGYRFTAP